MSWNSPLISCTKIIMTTTRPAKVVIMACSSRPERTRSWFSTATKIPTAAILKIRSTFMLSPLPPQPLPGGLFEIGLQQENDRQRTGAHAQHTYCTPISWEEALPGDLVFYPGDEHVGIVGGRDENGELLIVHCAFSQDNVVITEKSGFVSIARPNYYSE